MLAEFLGTFVLGGFAYGWDTTAVLMGKSNHSISAGIGLCSAIYISAQVSGGHVNPGVTLAFCLTGRTKWKKFLPYIFAQMLGGFCMAALQYGLMYDAINHYGPGSSVSEVDVKYRMFTSFPSTDISLRSAILNQVVGGFFLILVTLAVTDTENVYTNPTVAPVTVGMAVMGIIASFSVNHISLNATLDFVARVMLSVFEGASEPFSYRDYMWFWIPILFPIIGSLCATLTYTGLITFHRPNMLYITSEKTMEQRPDTPEPVDTKF